MRKLLIILLLLWLPAQIGWAAISAYCQHESDATQGAPAHAGHHEHEHGAEAQAPGGDPAKDADTGKPTAAHLDCSVCHLTAAVLPAVQANITHAPPVRITALLHLAHPAPLPLRPERPNWAPA